MRHRTASLERDAPLAKKLQAEFIKSCDLPFLKDQYSDAFKSLCYLRDTPFHGHAARVLRYIYPYAQLLEEPEIISHNNYVTRFIELFTIPCVRRATLATFLVMLAQQMCGISITDFCSSTISVQAGAGNLQALLASSVFGPVNFVFAWPDIWTIDTGFDLHLSPNGLDSACSRFVFYQS
ncbi:hypothetical protein MMC07_009404 [Pseudocyphellaria aurata]|nr:hypothetical protein [Pseudocyphellaria aurata]